MLDFVNHFLMEKSLSVNESGKLNIICDGPDNNSNALHAKFLKLISESKNLIQMQTPYFTPDDELYSALMQALKNGVNIEIMFPSVPDKKLVYKASLLKLKQLQQAGAKVFFYKGFLHSKLYIFDNKTAIFGTLNFDIRCFYDNFEICAIAEKSGLLSSLYNIFENDKKCCKQKKDWRAGQSFFAWLFYELF